MPARFPLMSHSAMSTPLIALNRTGPLRQYELTYDDCQMSSIWSASRPIRNGLRYLSTAGWTSVGALGERGTAQPIQARLAGRHLDDHQADLAGSGEDRPDIGDLQRRQPARPLRLRLIRAPLPPRPVRQVRQRSPQRGTDRQPPQDLAPIHGWPHSLTPVDRPSGRTRIRSPRPRRLLRRLSGPGRRRNTVVLPPRMTSRSEVLPGHRHDRQPGEKTGLSGSLSVVRMRFRQGRPLAAFRPWCPARGTSFWGLV